MGVATALAVGGLAVGAAGLIQHQVQSDQQAGAAKQAGDAAAANAAQAQTSAQAGAATLNPVVAQQQAQANQMAALNGGQKQNDVYTAETNLAGQQQGLVGQQQGLATQLQDAANGGGPNPAKEMLNQATNANIQQAAGTISSAKGINPALAARLAGQNATSSLQNSAGQAAVMGANQQIAARGQLMGQQQAIGNTQQAIGNTYAQQGAIGNQQVSQQLNASQLASNTALQQQNLAQGNAAQQQNANLATQGMNQNQSQFNTGQTNKMVGGLASGIGAVAQTGLGSSSTGQSQTPAPYNGAGTNAVTATNPNGAAVGDYQGLAKGGLVGSEPKSYVSHHFKGVRPPVAAPAIKMAQGGAVPAMVSPGEVYLSPAQVGQVAKGADPIKAGEKIPGKAKVKGNSLKNDTVPKTLEEGGIVLPKSVMESKHPHWAAHKFVAEVMAKQGLKKSLKDIK